MPGASRASEPINGSRCMVLKFRYTSRAAEFKIFEVHFCPPFFFGLTVGGRCLITFSNSPPAASACWIRWRLNLLYSASANPMAMSWEIFPV